MESSSRDKRLNDTSQMQSPRHYCLTAALEHSACHACKMRAAASFSKSAATLWLAPTTGSCCRAASTRGIVVLGPADSVSSASSCIIATAVSACWGCTANSTRLTSLRSEGSPAASAPADNARHASPAPPLQLSRRQSDLAATCNFSRRKVQRMLDAAAAGLSVQGALMQLLGRQHATKRLRRLRRGFDRKKVNRGKYR